MSGMQKPFANEGKKNDPPPPPPPPPPAKSGPGFFGKLFRLVVFVAVIGAAGSMIWHGKKLGEEREVQAARRANPTTFNEADARAKAKLVPPWDWSTPEWEGWWASVKSFGSTAGAKIAAQTASLREKGAALLNEWKASSGAATTTASSSATGATGATAGTGEAATGGATTGAEPAGKTDAPATGLATDPDWGRAVTLLHDGEALWNKNELKAARPKMEEAVKLLDGLKTKYAGDSRLEAAHALAKDYLDNINSRDF